MSNVVSPWGYLVGEAKVNENLLEILQELTEKAKAGEIVGIAASYTYKDGMASYRIGGMIGGFSALGACAAMQEQVRRVAMDE